MIAVPVNPSRNCAAEVINGGVLTYLDEIGDEADHHIPNCKAQV